MLRVKNEGKIKFYTDDGVELAPNSSSDEEFLKSVQNVDFRVQQKFLFDPAKDYALRSELKPSSLTQDERSLENELSQDSASGLWYPSRWVYEYQKGTLVEREENFLEVISINQPIDPKRFTLADIESLIPLGTPVIWKLDSPPPAKGMFLWDGKKVVGLSDYQVGNNRADAPWSRRLFLICVNTAGISAIVAIACFRAWRKQRCMATDVPGELS